MSNEQKNIVGSIRKSKAVKLFLSFIILLIVVGLGYYFLFANAMAITINSTNYSKNDINRLYDVEMMIAKKNNQNNIRSKNDVLYNLAEGEVQAKILNDFGISILRDQSVQRLEELIADKAMLSDIKETLGSRYYDLFVKPVVVREVFRSFYTNNNPNQNLATSLLGLAQQKGFDEAMNQLGLSSQVLLIPNDKNNEVFFKDISDFIAKNGLGNRVFNKIINFKGGYLVMVPEQIRDDGLIVRGYLVQYNNVREYLMQKAEKIDIKFGFASYQYKDLVRDNGIFKVRN